MKVNFTHQQFCSLNRTIFAETLVLGLQRSFVSRSGVVLTTNTLQTLVWFPWTVRFHVTLYFKKQWCSVFGNVSNFLLLWGWLAWRTHTFFLSEYTLYNLHSQLVFMCMSQNRILVPVAPAVCKLKSSPVIMKLITKLLFMHCKDKSSNLYPWCNCF